MIRRHETLARLLEQADGEIKAGRVISSELKEQMFAADPSLRGRWPLFQEVAKQKYTELMEAPVQEEEGTPVPVFTGVCLTNPDMQAERARMIDFLTVKLAVAGVGITDLGFACSVRRDFDGIPESNALDRVLRYEASAERRLARALDRLERLQRRRNGEMVPPPVSVRLSR
jgi:hypothetical protein